MSDTTPEKTGEANTCLSSNRQIPATLPINPWDPSQFPEGGIKAWLVVAVALILSLAIGMFQAYYQANQLRDYSSSQVSWIGSLELFMMLAGGIVVGRLYDSFGPTWILIFGTFFHVFGLMMASLSMNYSQIILSQGICSPIGISCLFIPATTCTTTWFMKKRAFALGIVVTGSSIGGVIFPIMLDHLVVKVGFGWTMRICAFAMLILLVFGILTVRSRIPPMPKPFEFGSYYQPFKEAPFVLTTIASFIFYLGLFLPINYIQVQALSYGVKSSLADNLIPILNSASIIGRVLPGYVADKFGRYNTQIVMCIFSGIIVLALWLPVTSNAGIIIFAALYGLSSGAFVSLIPALLAEISDMRELGLRSGLEFAILSLPALVSNPIGGALIEYDHGGFLGLQIWTGIILLAGGVMYIGARSSLVGFKIIIKI
ncbi:Fujikurins efflux protein [Lachnellula subtilissima]|uniref:Fujikurins efflux protein n=1 Tax=Lachnellula subtilissima TaxID=602034 RepID=A0A8H8RLM0_9HELO|nr:Fujikurins efflux protein [Lachnellula subtilissima]